MNVAFRVRHSNTELRRLSQQELRRARELFQNGEQLGRFADEFQFDTELEAFQAIGASLGMPVIDLSKVEVEQEALKNFPVRLVHRHFLFPISRTDSEIQIVTGNPFDVQAADAVADATGLFVNTVFRASLGEDIDLSWKTIFERFNADLANGVGNLLSRSLTLCKKQLNSQLPHFDRSLATKEQLEIAERLKSAVIEVCVDFDAYRISSALNKMNSILSVVDKYLSETTPWKLKSEEQKGTLSNILYVSLASLRVVGFCFYAFFPKKFDILLNLLGEDTTDQTNFIEKAKGFWNLKAGHTFSEIPRLFERLDLKTAF